MLAQGFTIAGSSLTLLKAGEQGVVTHINSANPTIIQKLRAMNIVPGVVLTLEQRFPRFIVRAGMDHSALTPELMEAVYVRLKR